jgi:hypothetical protein
LLLLPLVVVFGSRIGDREEVLAGVAAVGVGIVEAAAVLRP